MEKKETLYGALGEFERRIEPLGILHADEDITVFRVKDWEGLWQIFEEAKQEFPQITNYKTENYWELHLRRVAWFMKWFGDSK